jgi:hypothetical protein
MVNRKWRLDLDGCGPKDDSTGYDASMRDLLDAEKQQWYTLMPSRHSIYKMV